MKLDMTNAHLLDKETLCFIIENQDKLIRLLTMQVKQLKQRNEQLRESLEVQLLR